ALGARGKKLPRGRRLQKGGARCAPKQGLRTDVRFRKSPERRQRLRCQRDSVQVLLPESEHSAPRLQRGARAEGAACRHATGEGRLASEVVCRRHGGPRQDPELVPLNDGARSSGWYTAHYFFGPGLVERDHTSCGVFRDALKFAESKL